MVKVLLEYYAAENELMVIKTKLMKLLACEKGFLNLYNEDVLRTNNALASFSFLNQIFKMLFGYYAYENYMDFVKKTQQGSEVNKLERIFLMEWFKSCGFTTWESFSPLVLHYYPEVTSKGLRDFYDGKLYTPDVLKKVDFVRQIIGK